MTKRMIIFTASVVLLFVTRTVPAGPFRMVGYDSFSTGTANSQMVFGQGIGVLYSNPALLMDIEEQIGVRFVLYQSGLSAKLLARPQNADVPLSFYDSDVGIEGTNLDRPLPTAELPIARQDNNQDSATAYVGVGFSHSLGLEYFRLGVNFLVPTSGLMSLGALYPDEREQYFTNTVHFTRFGEWDRMMSLLVGIAGRPLSWLQVGASVETALNISASLDVYIPEASVQDYALANTVMKTSPSYRGIVGITASPLDFLRLSLVWRDRRYNKVDAVASLKLWNYHESGDATVPKRVVQYHVMALDYEPMELSLAAGVTFLDLHAEVNATWNDWSGYLDPHHQRPQKSAQFRDPNTGEILGNGERFSFSDTVSFSAGLFYQYIEGFTATLGFGYRPSPIPPQTGRTNYIDSDLLNFSAGHRFCFSLWGEQQLIADIGFQFFKMVDTTVYKDPTLIKDEFPDRARTLIGGQPMPEAQGLQTNNPGFPGIEFGGWLLVASTSLSYVF